MNTKLSGLRIFSIENMVYPQQLIKDLAKICTYWNVISPVSHVQMVSKLAQKLGNGSSYLMYEYLTYPMNDLRTQKLIKDLAKNCSYWELVSPFSQVQMGSKLAQDSRNVYSSLLYEYFPYTMNGSRTVAN
jgi:hypothetical protein